jgi:DNA polymerase-1
MANIPNEYRTNGTITLLGKELRSLWKAEAPNTLVGVDAEGIQLRIFAHYIDDAAFTKSLVEGKKDDGSDPHSLNKRILGKVCKDRQVAKRFIYALLLGAGMEKLAEVLECSRDECQSALDRLMERYQGYNYLKKTVIPSDARRGYFSGIDGRHVPIPGVTVGERKHLCMSGYLQSGEAIIVKRAGVTINQAFEKYGGEERPKLVDIIHDEFQAEVPRHLVMDAAQIMADAIKESGEYYKLKCPMAGSYWDGKRYTIGENWSLTH